MFVPGSQLVVLNTTLRHDPHKAWPNTLAACRRHPHRDAEIFSYIVDGQLSHADSMGNQEALGRGSVQFMSAGTGIAFPPSMPPPCSRFTCNLGGRVHAILACICIG